MLDPVVRRPLVMWPQIQLFIVSIRLSLLNSTYFASQHHDSFTYRPTSIKSCSLRVDFRKEELRIEDVGGWGVEMMLPARALFEWVTCNFSMVYMLIRAQESILLSQFLIKFQVHLLLWRMRRRRIGGGDACNIFISEPILWCVASVSLVEPTTTSSPSM